MAQRTLETVVRDLLKQIGLLTTKIDALESKIDDQSKIIAIQEQTTSALRLAVEGKLLSITSKVAETTTPTSAPELKDHPAPPRPIRQARINAAQKKLSLSNNAAKKSAVTSRRASVSETSNTSEMVREDPSTAQAMSASSLSRPIGGSNDGKRKPIGATATESGVGENGTTTYCLKGAGNKNTGNEWKIVRNKKKTRRPITVGLGKENDELQAVENMKYIQAWSFRPDTTAEKITSFLNTIINSIDYTVERRSIKTTRHASFLIGIPESIYDVVTAPTAWPPGVRFVPWIPFRQRPHREWGNAHQSTARTASAAAAGASAR